MTPPTEIILEGPFQTIIEAPSGHVIEIVGGGGGNATRLRGRQISVTAPANGEALVWNASASEWQPTNIGTQAEVDALSASLAAHVANVANPHVVTAAQVGAYTIAATDAAIAAHATRTDNPHAVTKAQVGLGNVEDTALSTWAGSGNITTVGTLVAGAVPASLLTGTLAYARLPAGSGTWSVGDSAALMVFASSLTVSRVGGSGGAVLGVDVPAANNASLNFSSAASLRWQLRKNSTAEAGADAGSDLQLLARTDTGSSIDTPLTIIRAAGGAITLARPVSVTGALTVTALQYINDTSNANMTRGLTINQGNSDDQILALKSSDVATGLTSITTQPVETDDFLTFSKFSATLGGVLMQALAEDAAVTQVWTVRAYGGTANTTKTSAGVGLITFYASEHDGANALANITADGNIFAVRGRIGGADATQLMVDANATAGYTRLLIWDVDNGALERVSVGIADSGGAGFKLLRIPN